MDTLLRPERARAGGRVTWFTVLGLVLVPLTVGGLLTWALWQPTERLSRMDAAVVNLDTPVKVNGQTVPLGRELAAGLVTSTGATASTASATTSPTATPSPSASASPTASPSMSPTPAANVSGSDATTNFTWVVTDASDAAAGLADGRYATVVTIPSGFSAAATSTATDPTHAEKATIDIAMSDRARIVDTAVAQAVTSTAVRVLGQQLTTTYLQNVFIGFDTLHGKLTEAADGAGKLASGAQSLTGGAQQLASGAGQLDTGATSLASGSAQLASGLDTLASQTSSSATSAAAAVPGAQQLASGLSALSAGVNGTGGLASGTASLSSGASQFEAGLSGFLSQISTLAVDCKAGQQAKCDELFTAIAEQPTTAAAGTPGLMGSAAALAQGAAGLDAAVNTGVNGAPSLASSTAQLAAGGKSIADGAASSVTGLRTLASYLAKSASAAHQLASGATALASGASQVSSGATSLGSGADSIASGTSSLADGLGQAAAQVPASTAEQAKTLAGVVADPVAASNGNTSLFGSSSVPFLIVVALWLGGLATFLVLGAQPARALGSTRSSLSLALRAFAPAALIGAIQGVVLTASMAAVLNLSPGGWVAFGAVAALAGVVFAAVNQGLVAVFRGVGRFVSVVIAVVALATVVVSTVPAVLDSLFGLLPPSPALGALQAVATGSGSVLGPVVLLVVWALAGLGLTVAAIARHRVVPAGQLARWARVA